MLIHSPLDELEMSRTASEYKLQTNPTIQYLNFFSPVLLSSMNSLGWLKPQQTDALDKHGKDGREDQKSSWMNGKSYIFIVNKLQSHMYEPAIQRALE